MTVSNHYQNERQERERVIKEIGEGEEVREFFWDKGHKDGPEVHVLTSTGLIKIYNAWTGKHITTLIARPGQIRRYYEMVGERAPKNLVDIAYKHQNQGLNYA